MPDGSTRIIPNLAEFWNLARSETAPTDNRNWARHRLIEHAKQSGDEALWIEIAEHLSGLAQKNALPKRLYIRFEADCPPALFKPILALPKEPAPTSYAGWGRPSSTGKHKMQRHFDEQKRRRKWR